MAIQREWTVNLGQRTAIERVGHLFCELFLRLRCVGLTEGDSCALPLTQVELADALGLSNVHVNRTLQELRRAGLIVLKGGRLTIPDFAALQKASSSIRATCISTGRGVTSTPTNPPPHEVVGAFRTTGSLDDHGLCPDRHRRAGGSCWPSCGIGSAPRWPRPG